MEVCCVTSDFLSRRWVNPIQPQLSYPQTLLVDTSRRVLHIRYGETPVDHRTYPISMPSPNPLQQLHGLDRSSPEFPCQLTGVLLGEDFVDCVQNPPCEDLGPFVEYFDSVRLRVTFVFPPLNVVAGPRRPRPYRVCFSPLPIRTSENLWCQQGPADIARTLRRSSESERSPDRLRNPGRYARWDPRRTAGSR